MSDDGIQYWGINIESFQSVWEQAERKVIVIELFFVFCLFLFQFIRFPVSFEKGDPNPSNQAASDNDTTDEGERVTRDLTFHTVNHFIAAGLALWEGGVASIIFVVLHLIFFGLLFFGLRAGKDNLKMIGIFGVGLFNICLMIAGLCEI